MQKPWKRNRRSLFALLMTDVLFNLLAFYMLMVGVKTEALTTSEALAAEVPGLKKDVTGMKGMLAKAEEDLTKAKEQGDKAQSLLKGKDVKFGRLKKEFQLLTSKLGGLKKTISQQDVVIKNFQKHFRAGKPITLLVMIDVTASMQQPIDDLLSALSAVCEYLPMTSKQFSVGILGFRQGVVAEFPVTPILPHYEDNSRSEQSVLNFVKSLRPVNAWTEQESVFERAKSMLQAAGSSADPESVVHIVYLSDTGPSELDGVVGYNATERQMKARILRSMQQWASRGQRGISSLYVESEYTKKDPAGSESRQWFEALGSVSESSGFYTDSSELLRALLKATRN